jgi:hypothetical protein
MYWLTSPDSSRPLATKGWAGLRMKMYSFLFTGEGIMTRTWLWRMMAVLFIINGLSQLSWAQESQTGNSWLDAPVQDDGPPG